MKKVDTDVSVLFGLAALNYLYRKLDAAHDLLSLAEHIEPNNLSVKEFLSVIKLESGDHAGALDTIKLLENASYPLPQELRAAKQQAERATSKQRFM